MCVKRSEEKSRVFTSENLRNCKKSKNPRNRPHTGISRLSRVKNRGTNSPLALSCFYNLLYPSEYGATVPSSCEAYGGMCLSESGCLRQAYRWAARPGAAERPGPGWLRLPLRRICDAQDRCGSLQIHPAAGVQGVEDLVRDVAPRHHASNEHVHVRLAGHAGNGGLQRRVRARQGWWRSASGC